MFRQFFRKRVFLPNIISGGFHGFKDIVSDPGISNITESSGQPSGNDTMPTIQQLCQQYRSILDHRKTRSCINGITGKEICVNSNQSGFKRINLEPI
ncbi:hypothetical protein NC99_04310 [Sunxiuqinia dokdonensis]|uniref:Uncharacterized protein n=1 Tax=Sunxiuqinia dokdonensis TaxID=1409788 RepID=A0A0L8VE22_9BACT|nr:hypothetical protein NC99_04310 [Sunxiuqinia dokdonensis]